MINRIRLLPITIFLATLMLTVKLGDIWNGATSDDSTIMRIQPALAQKATEKDEKPATKPLAKLDVSEKNQRRKA